MKLPANVWKAVMDGIMEANYTCKLRNITVPVLIFWGSNDSICFRNDQDNFVQNLKNTKFIVYDGTGHALHWEEPERFVEDVVSFLNDLK